MANKRIRLSDTDEGFCLVSVTKTKYIVKAHLEVYIDSYTVPIIFA